MCGPFPLMYTVCMNIKEVAKKAGVSIATVSRVMNSPEKVNEKTKEKVLTVMRELNYTPNWGARNLHTSRTYLIGVIVPDNLWQSYMQIAKGIEKIVLQKNCNIILCTTGYDRDTELKHINTLVTRNIDGLILVDSVLNKNDLQDLKDKKVHFVLVERTADSGDEDVVYTDYDVAAETAVNYFLEMGRKKIAMILPDINNYSNIEKTEGYKRALAENGSCRPMIYKGENTIEGGFVATQRILDGDDIPDAVFMGTDTMAFGAVEALKQNGLSADDIGIIGYGGLEEGAIVEPKLTTVTKPSYRMGLTAGRMLFDRIEADGYDADRPQAVMLKSRLKIRKSCGNKERLREIW